MKQSRYDLLLHEKNLYKAFTILALPVFMANIIKSLHDLVDTYFIGQMENSVAAQAGLSIAWPPINILMSFTIGLSVAGVSVISQLLGAGKKEDAKKYSGLLVLLSVGLGVLVNTILYFLAPGILSLMGAEGDVHIAATSYLRTRSFEMIFTFLFCAFQAIRQAKGDTITPVILSTTSVVINIILTAYFIRICGMGVEGAALATVIGQGLITPVCLFLLFRKKEENHLQLTDLRFELESMKKLFTIATPSACSQAFSAFGFLILQAVILDYGEVVTAAFSIGNKITNLLLMPVMALGSVLAAYVGQNIGAKQPERAMKAYRVSRNLGLIISVIGAVALYLFHKPMIELLSNNAETQLVAAEYMFWVVLTQPLMSLFQNYIGVFNGSGNTRFSFAMSTTRLWLIRLPLILCFKTFTELGRVGIWAAMVISNFIIVLFGSLLFKKVDFKPKV